MSLPERAIAGALLAAAVAVAARRAGALSPSGAWGAVVTGTLAASAGWRWAATLVAFFVTSSLLSRWRRSAKAATAAIVGRGERRDVWQVAANGGIFAGCAAASIVQPWEGWGVLAVGALAAATADTWATEIGTAVGGRPRTVLGWRPVEPGTSGAVTAVGSAALLAGALFLGTVAVATGFPLRVLVPAIAGGVAGALADTLAGAAVQERRWCPRCDRATERPVHDCGTATRWAGGVRGFGNDVVNLTSSAVGALVALSWWRLLT